MVRSYRCPHKRIEMVVSRGSLLWLAVGAVAALAAASAQVFPDALLTNSLHVNPRTASHIPPAARISRTLQQSAGSQPTAAAGPVGEGILDIASYEAAQARTGRFIYTYAVLMCLAWVGLLPFGILLAQSRWAQPLRNAVLGKKVWFWLHMAVNATGVVLVIVAFAIATSKSTGMGKERGSGSVALTHKALGIIAFALLLLQTVAAFIRPHPHLALRGVWNAVHHNLGRVVVLVAWINIWLGVSIGYRRLPGASLARWLGPLAAAQGILLLAYLLNQGLKKRTFKEEATEEKWQDRLAERDNYHHGDGVVVTAGAPAGPGSLSDSAGSSGNAAGDIYGSSIRATARVAYPTIQAE